MESKFWIWKDTVDNNSFMLGVTAGKGITAWTTLFIDGISDLFGSEFSNECKQAKPGVPFVVKCTLEIER